MSRSMYMRMATLAGGVKTHNSEPNHSTRSRAWRLAGGFARLGPRVRRRAAGCFGLARCRACMCHSLACRHRFLTSTPGGFATRIYSPLKVIFKLIWPKLCNPNQFQKEDIGFPAIEIDRGRGGLASGLNRVVLKILSFPGPLPKVPP